MAVTATDHSLESVAHKAGSILEHEFISGLCNFAAKDVDDNSDEDEGEGPAPESRQRSDSSPERRVPRPSFPHPVPCL